MKTVLLDFFKKIGKQSEFKLFLDLFHHIPKSQFGVIKISGKVLEKNLDIIAEDIAYLNKLEIYPVIVHGAGSELDRRLPNSKKIDGYRVTPKEDIMVIKEVFDGIAHQLIEKIKEKGGNAEHCPPLFECEQIEKLGYVGEVKGLKNKAVLDMINRNSTVIISPLGFKDDDFYNINADTAAKEVVKSLHSRKFILLTDTGGILNEQNQIIPFLNLSEEENFAKHITGGMLLKVREIKNFLEETPNCEVVITSAEKLIKEIFTIKGEGTFIKYHTIKSTNDVQKLDLEKLKSLLEDAFNKKLVPDYFTEEFQEVIYQAGYEGVAFIQVLKSIPYIDKIAVSKARQGTGLAKSIWEKIEDKYDKFMWRASNDNSFNTFYSSRCDGMIRKKDWTFFWKNLEDHEILDCMNNVLAKRKTLLTENEIEQKGL